MLRPETIAEFAEVHSSGIDAVTGTDVHTFGLGFEIQGTRYPFLGADAFGHSGAAGAQAFADPPQRRGTMTAIPTTRTCDGNGGNMLGDHPMDVLLLATDLQASRDFYAQKIGLEIVQEKEDAVWFKCGGGSRLAVGKSTIGTADEQDQATWRVDDLAAEVAQLRARGVEILDIDMPDLGIKTVDGIADVGHAFAAWFVDPGKNSLSILQFK